MLWCATPPNTHLIGRSHLGTSHLPCYGPEYLSCTPGRSRGPALDEVGRPGDQEPTQQRGLQVACRVGYEGRTLGGWKVGALHCSVQPAGSWEPSTGFLAPTSLASPSALPTLPSMCPPHCHASGLAAFRVPCPLATPGMWHKALPMGPAPVTGPWCYPSPRTRALGSAMPLRHRRILAAAHLPLSAQPEAFWDRSSRWGGAHRECCQPCSHRQVPFPRPVSIHPRRAVSSRTEDIPCLAGCGSHFGTGCSRQAGGSSGPAPSPTFFDLGYSPPSLPHCSSQAGWPATFTTPWACFGPHHLGTHTMRGTGFACCFKMRNCVLEPLPGRTGPAVV